MEHEPGVGAAHADPTVRDGVLAEVDASVTVQLVQLVVGDDLIWGATARMVGDLLDRLPEDLLAA